MATTNARDTERQGGQDQVLILLEEIARTNQKLNEENRVLREELKQRDEKNRQAFASLEQKLGEATNQSPPETKRKRRRVQEVRVPTQCRVIHFIFLKYFCLSVDVPRLMNEIHSL